MISRLLVTLCVTLLVATQLTAAETAPSSPQSYALLIGGLPGEEPYNQWYADWLGRFQKYLTQSAAVPAANVTVLSGDAATKDAVLGAIGNLSQRIKPQDQFILFIVGHGEVSGAAPTLALPGPDLSAPELAAALKPITSKNQVILNLSASSGDFLKSLASPVRVNITATSPTEAEAPVFAEFFLRGLESKRAEPNGEITLLKAYNWAAQQTIFWIVRWQQTGGPSGPKMWKASGKETVAIFEKLYPHLPSRKLDPASNRNVEDAEVVVQPPNGEITPAWAGRRVINEHAMLEDCGTEVGVSILGKEEGIKLIAGEKPKDPGYLAGRTVLGKPQKP